MSSADPYRAATSASANAATWPLAGKINAGIAILALSAIAAHLILAYLIRASPAWSSAPLIAALAIGGSMLVFDLLKQLFKGKFGSDLLAGISIVTAVFLGEYLAGTLVVLMLAGGETLETFAVRSASSVLRALAQRMPSIAHLKHGDQTTDIPIADIKVNDELMVLPHETCPADGVVLDGHGSMDEAYLTGEPYLIEKAPGSEVISGAINGPAALVIRATRTPNDSRYARIMQVMNESQQSRPELRRIGDTLGALYTPLAVLIAVIAGVAAQDPLRFLAVLVVATPCPLLIAIPVAIIGSISLSAKRGIIVKDPAVLEQLSTCKTIFFDKTGTLTYGKPSLTQITCAPGITENEALALAGGVERYSRHPLASAVLEAAQSRGVSLAQITDVHEPPGQGLIGTANGRRILLTGRKRLSPAVQSQLSPPSTGLECILMIDDRYAAMLQFRDTPRADARQFIKHLGPQHQIADLVLLTGDRAAEAQQVAQSVGITKVFADKSPEEKLAIVKTETAKHHTAYLGDGINDAPSLLAATVGVAFGKASDVTAEAASAVILDSSLRKLDEFMHISKRLRTIALQSAVGGMALSLIGIGFAATGHLPPVAGAVFQEIIDVVAVLNALRAAAPGKTTSDM